MTAPGNSEPSSEPDSASWLARLRRFWSAPIDALERYLDRARDRQEDSMGSLAHKNGKAREQ